MRTVVIANPRSANGAVGARWSRIAADLHTNLGELDERLTRTPGDATRLAREAIAEGADLVVAVGGDGTINEVANGFFPPEGERRDGARPALGVIPLGTGGDFRRTLALENDLARAARALRDGSERAIDVGKVAYTTEDGATATRRFVNIASFGISGLVDSIVNRSSKALGGRVSFLLATLRAAAKWTNQRVLLRFDEGDEEEQLIQTVAVANGKYFGGGMKIAPEARLDDGLFDVVVLGDLGLSDLLVSGRRVYRGTHLDLPKVHARRAARLEARPVLPSARILLDVDGEQPGCLPATFEIERAALRLRWPSGGDLPVPPRPAKPDEPPGRGSGALETAASSDSGAANSADPRGDARSSRGSAGA